MSFHANQPHGGGPPNMAQSFNAMLQRSVQDPGQLEPPADVPGRPNSSLGMRQPTRCLHKGASLTVSTQATAAYTAPRPRHSMAPMSSAVREGQLPRQFCR